MSPGRWQVWQFFCSTGTTSRWNVISLSVAANALESVAPARRAIDDARRDEAAEFRGHHWHRWHCRGHDLLLESEADRNRLYALRLAASPLVVEEVLVAREEVVVEGPRAQVLDAPVGLALEAHLVEERPQPLDLSAG